eukprot:4365506-Alexandrium_andersonii.AAC.1
MAPSSTRAELLGLNLALLVPVPMRLGVDSQAVVSRFAQFLDRRIGGSWPRDSVQMYEGPRMVFDVRWCLARDGDLWQQAFDNVQRRGVD